MFVASAGNTLAVKVEVSPTFILAVALNKVTDSTGIPAAVTVTIQVAVIAESFPATLAVIVALPAAFPLTIPPATVATLSFDDVQVTLLSVAFAGDTTASKVIVSFCAIVTFI